MPNDIANNMADTIHQLEKELKDLREENKVMTSECDRLIKEKGELLTKVSGGDVLRICQLEEREKEYKRLLKAAVEDNKNVLTENFGDICQFCKHGSNPTAQCCKPHNGSGSWCCENAEWRYADEAFALIGEEGVNNA